MVSARRLVRAGLLGLAAIVCLSASTAATAAPLRGVLDRTLGGDGRVLSDLAPAFAGSEFRSLVRQSDGKLLLLAEVGIPDGQREPVIQRREPSGALDRSFGSDGETVVPKARDLALSGLAHARSCSPSSPMDGLPPTSRGASCRLTQGGPLPVAIETMSMRSTAAP